MSELRFDIAVIGGGPAGIGAACAAAEAGRHVALIDETPWLGGQIWRGQQSPASSGAAGRWFGRFNRSGAVLLDKTCIIASPEAGLLLAERAGQPCRIRYERLIVATGARELFIPFPGWTLPGVMGPGGLLSLVKNGWPIKGQRVVVAGSGPLLLAGAEGLVRHGAEVVAIIEQAGWGNIARFGLGLCRRPGKLRQALGLKFTLRGVPWRCGSWPIRAEGCDKIQNVTLTDGKRTWTKPCDILACAFGLVPNIELPMALGCEIEKGFVRVDSAQKTTVQNIHAAGEITGIGGADCALIEGQIAGYSAAGAADAAHKLFAQRASWHCFRLELARAFGLRQELRSLARDETILCRCEDVPLGRLKEFSEWREAKLHTRCGMGPCQGRVCGAAAKELLGWGMESVRPPVCPAKVACLIRDA